MGGGEEKDWGRERHAETGPGREKETDGERQKDRD